MKTATFFLTCLLCFGGGYIAGREHLKYEMKTALAEAGKSFSEAFSVTRKSTGNPGEIDPVKKAYLQKIELLDFSSKNYKPYGEGLVPGVTFRLKNSGDKAVKQVEVRVFFLDAGGAVISEKGFRPLDDVLKPGYIWQMPESRYYSADSVPKEWKEGSTRAEVSDVEFPDSK